MKKSRLLSWIVSVCLLGVSLCMAVEIPGANGSDGELKDTLNDCANGIYTINLGCAATKVWDANPDARGCGVYDPEKWAVVFKYSSVQIDEGCTVKFVNHPANPPVYWLVSGNVIINGNVNLDGAHGQDKDDTKADYCSIPGPGGFAGGFRTEGNGFGPGGGTGKGYGGAGASFANLGNVRNGYSAANAPGSCYGDDTLIPLVGGSGGTRGLDNNTFYLYMGGGAGGGAILIASEGTIILNGAIQARGGRGGGLQSATYTSGYTSTYGYTLLGGGGSGGAVRILADHLSGTGYIDVGSQKGTNATMSEEVNRPVRDITASAPGSVGRIRLDVNDYFFLRGDRSTERDQFEHWETYPSIGDSMTAVLWPEAKVTPLTLGGVSLPTDPRYRSSGYHECISFANAGERELVFQTENIPTNANVVVKVTPRQTSGNATGAYVVPTMDDGGTFARATWRAQIPLNGSRTTFQVLVSTTALYE